MIFKPRPAQQAIINYQGGLVGVSAVPGSGKTQTLSSLAARLIMEGWIEEGQEILIVTLVNSAVDNFSRRIRGFIQESHLLPYGYRVRTLHGLAHDIVRERPTLAGVDRDFKIIDERTSNQILRSVADAWIHANPSAMDAWISSDLSEYQYQQVQKKYFPDWLSNYATSFIRQAKNLQITPDILRERLQKVNSPFPLLQMGCSLYEDYQRALIFRGGVDFDDLIWMSLRILQADTDFLYRLRRRWPVILEDEAQDSSLIQETILRLLAGPDGNWVRVGDPNQAIFETFTTASPEFLRRFMSEPGVSAQSLPDSGRSSPSIIKLANHLIQWTSEEHPNLQLRHALTQPYIQPTPPGDPQPNPPENPELVRFIKKGFDPAEEIQWVAESAGRWLAAHPDNTLAILSPRNERGAEMVEQLKKMQVPYIEILQSTQATRQAAEALACILKFMSEPLSAVKLSEVYKIWCTQKKTDEDHDRIALGMRIIKKCPQVEDFLWPRIDQGWLSTLSADPAVPSEIITDLSAFQTIICEWLDSIILPVDQIILTIAQGLFSKSADLAIAYKLARLMASLLDENPAGQLKEIAEEISRIAQNERKFIGFSEEDTGFDSQKYKGQAVVTTMHKAKGLEWDRVYLLSVNNYDFPSADPHDNFISERWFIRGRLNLEAEGLSQLEALANSDLVALYLPEGEATLHARIDYAAERLRLLYVGITRACRELILTWNTGRENNRSFPSVPFQELRTFWEQLYGPTR